MNAEMMKERREGGRIRKWLPWLEVATLLAQEPHCPEPAPTPSKAASRSWDG